MEERPTNSEDHITQIETASPRGDEEVEPCDSITSQNRLFNQTDGDDTTTPFLCFWQEKKAVVDEVDSAIAASRLPMAVSPHFSDLVRSRHNSGSNPIIKKVVEIDKEKVKEARADPKVTVAVMSLQVDTKRFPNTVRMRSEMFGWLVVIVGIYYSLPVFQLVFNYQRQTDETGNKDICYYNYLCTYPWGPFQDYGHIFSNIGYIISGIFFIVVVHLRKYKYRQLLKKWDSKSEELGVLHPRRCGIPEHYGIFYAMGAALTMEGVLSGCYHICPTTENFQFDTTFMYLMFVLVFLKVSQIRGI